jgi:hypothetical protein
MEKEIRFLSSKLEIRENDVEDDKKEKYLDGYAVKWEQLSKKLGWYYRFREKFVKGAFEQSLKDDEQRALWNHNTDIVLGNTKPKTLELSEDDVGLRFSIKLPKNSWGEDSYESVQRGDVDGVSFGFKVSLEEWNETDPDDVIRTIKTAKLFEVSPTVFPAYEGASEVSVRNYDPYKEYKEKQEKQDPGSKENRNNFSELRKKLVEV